MDTSLKLDLRPQTGKYHNMTHKERALEHAKTKVEQNVTEYAHRRALQIMLETHGTISEREKQLETLQAHLKKDILENPIDMDKKTKDSEFVMRYCASVLSVPAHALTVTQLCKKSEAGEDIMFNEKIGLPFGFSYYVKKGTDPYIIKRIFEEEKQKKYDNKEFLISYEAFTTHYKDEVFVEKHNLDKNFCLDSDDEPEFTREPIEPAPVTPRELSQSPTFHVDEQDYDIQSDYSEDDLEH